MEGTHMEKNRRKSARPAHAAMVIAAFLALFATGLVTATPAAAAGNWQNPGLWNFYLQDGALLLAGRGSDPGFFSPTVPYECNNGTNDDGNAGNGSNPAGGQNASGQDANPDFTAPTDAECGSNIDDSEIQGGIQSRILATIAANIAAIGTGTITTPFALPTLYQYTNATNVPLLGSINGVTSVVINVTSASLASDPSTGNMTITMSLTVNITAPGVGACDPLVINPVNMTTGVSGASTGNPLSPTTGLVNMVDNLYTVPGATGGLFGQCTSLNAALGLPAPAGASKIRFRFRVLPQAGNVNAVVTGVTGLPGAVNEGDNLTLTPTATDANATLCVAPGPCGFPTPTYNWRWTQTAGPPVGDSYVLPTGERLLNNVDLVTGAAQFKIPDNGAYTFRIDAGDGGSVNFGTAFNLNINAAQVAPTVAAGNDVTVSAGKTAAQNPVKLAATVTDPAPADATGRTYAWTQAAVGPGNTCGVANPLTIATPTTLTSTFGTPAGACFVDLTMTATVNGQIAADVMRVNVIGTTVGSITGAVTECTATCIAATTGTAMAFNFPAFTFAGQAPIAAGTFAIGGLTAGNSYKVLYVVPGSNPAWFGGFSTSGSSLPLVAPYGGANVTVYGGVSAAGSLTGTVTVLPSGNAPNGTSVRLYEATSGQYVKQTTTTTGAYSFTGLPTASYKVWFGRGSATHEQRWADSGYNVSAAQAKAVVSGGAPVVVNTTLALKRLPATTSFAYGGGTTTSGSTTVLTDTRQAWVANQWVGFRAVLMGGRALSHVVSVRTISSNTATAITVSAGFQTGPDLSNFFILPANRLGSASAVGTTTTVIDASQAWTVNEWAGKQVNFISGAGGGGTRTITSNTATQLTFTPALSAATSNASPATIYQITPLGTDQQGNVSGFLTQARNGQWMLPTVAGNTEVRAYSATTGAFVGKVPITMAGIPTVGGANFNFMRWTADPAALNAQSGFADGGYKVLARMIGTGGGAPAFCSTWLGGLFPNVTGGPAQGNWSIAPTVTVTAGSNTHVDAQIRQDASCATTN